MTLYNVSDAGFSSARNTANLFVAGFWQMEETGFRPKYDLATSQRKHNTANNDGSDSENEAEKNDAEDEAKRFADALDQKTAEAYAQGYLDGQLAMAARLDEDQERENALAAAINRLKPADEAKLAKQLWKAVLSLFRQAVGEAGIDELFMRQRCEAAIESIGAELDEACLYVTPDDAGILQDYDCGVPIVADPDLLPGSVRLAYGAGEVTSGSLSIAREIETRIGAAGGASC